MTGQTYGDIRTGAYLVGSGIASKVLDKEIREAKTELYKLRLKRLAKETLREGIKKVDKIAKRADKKIGSSLASKAVYRKGRGLSSTYDIRKQLEPPASYADEPARYYKKTYTEEKKNFFFK